MKRNTHYLEFLFCHLLLTFFIGRVAFIVYNRHLAPGTLWDAVGACRSGLLAHDFVISAFLLAFPCLMGVVAARRSIPLRKMLTPYYILVGFIMAAVVVADIVMYEFWQFKLGAVVLSYAVYPEGAANSVSPWFLISKALMLIAYLCWTVIPCILLTPRRLEPQPSTRQWLGTQALIILFLCTMVCFIHVGDAYSRRRPLFYNHAAVNSVYAFFASFSAHENLSKRYNYLDEATREETFRGLYPQDTEDITDTLLNTRTPDILIVLMESFGGKFVQELGGIPGVAPHWSRLIPEGIFWENYYSNSFRTDRGTVSTYSGILSYPDVATMRMRDIHDRIPSLARTLNGQGYQTAYLYANVMSNMGKRDYLNDMEFRQLLDDKCFTPQEMDGAWGANDSTSAMKAYHLIARKDTTQRWMMAYQTLSSHEPWTVPYHRLEDPKLNAFAFTDQAVGDLIDSLKQTPQWDNLLVIMIPDHGYLYEQSFEDPEYFHSPMLWLGGAIRSPRRMTQLVNQSDLYATLLSQMGISHRDNPWSRNVLSRNYTHPFVYCNFPAGVMFRDTSGVSIYDITADCPITEKPDQDDKRIRKAQSILQTSYDWLQSLKE